ncbi:hypothetical protein, partial [Rhodoplanes sp. SY1]|uniref:hypothetical protein n=1 Tax=Rhodoplanes sp. SY1 TaxID=3166646 RepID=UPI0038B619F9
MAASHPATSRATASREVPAVIHGVSTGRAQRQATRTAQAKNGVRPEVATTPTMRAPASSGRSGVTRASVDGPGR